jgi:pantoate--beta-alanine ligase
MQIIENKSELDEFLKKIRNSGKKIGLIPTMGSIHKGHLSLIRNCHNLGYFSLITIFVNPTQFNDLNDFEKYPRDLEIDKKSLKLTNTDLLYLPKISDLYSKGIKSRKTIFDYRNILCDIHRPGHFDGVTTVVHSLFGLIKPDFAFFGEKDFQQLKIIKKVVENNNFPIVIHECASIRMPNGMSYSSRYKQFSISEIKIFDVVASIFLKKINELTKNIDRKFLENLEYKLVQSGIKKIDYLEIRNDITLLPTNKINNARLFVAFYIGKIRIIDNFILY